MDSDPLWLRVFLSGLGLTAGVAIVLIGVSWILSGAVAKGLLMSAAGTGATVMAIVSLRQCLRDAEK